MITISFNRLQFDKYKIRLNLAKTKAQNAINGIREINPIKFDIYMLQDLYKGEDNNILDKIMDTTLHQLDRAKITSKTIRELSVKGDYDAALKVLKENRLPDRDNEELLDKFLTVKDNIVGLTDGYEDEVREMASNTIKTPEGEAKYNKLKEICNLIEDLNDICNGNIFTTVTTYLIETNDTGVKVSNNWNYDEL